MKYNLLLLVLLLTFAGCKKNDQDSDSAEEPVLNEDPATFSQISSLDIGETGAAEITAYDPATFRLFVVNNGIVNKIDVIDFKNPAEMKIIGSISMAPYGGAVNSVAVSEGKLAAAIESTDKQANGKWSYSKQMIIRKLK